MGSLVQKLLTNQYYPLADIWKGVGWILDVTVGKWECHFRNCLVMQRDLLNEELSLSKVS